MTRGTTQQRARRYLCAAAALLLLVATASQAAARTAALGDATAPAGDATSARDEGSEPRPLVLVFTPGTAAGPLAARLEAELVAVGMTVRRIVVADETTFAELGPMVTAAKARGAIRVSGGAFGAEVWIPDPETGRAALRQALSSESRQGMESVIIPRTVEFLRASLLPAATAAPPTPSVEAVQAPPAPAPPPADSVLAVPAAPRPAGAPRLRITAGSAVVASAGGVGAFPVAAFSVGVRVLRRAGIEATALLPLSSPQLDTSAGTIRVSLTLAGLGAYATLFDRPRWSLEAAAGALAITARTNGDARGANLGLDQSMLSVAPYARAGATLKLTSWLAARADLIGGSAIIRVVISVADASGENHRVATWGRPFGTGLLSLQASWL